jgi:hypothetical protein
LAINLLAYRSLLITLLLQVVVLVALPKAPTTGQVAAVQVAFVQQLRQQVGVVL